MPRREQDWVRWLARAARLDNTSGVVTGIGDDCAVFRPERNTDLVFTTDMLVEDVHFQRSTHSAAEVGRKALTRGLSDIAAMGAAPRFCLLSLAVPPWVDDAWLRGFYRGWLALAKQKKAPLIGGDLSHARQLVCDVTVAGNVARGKAILRSGAEPGDRIYVSGRLGGSALGLAAQAGSAWLRHRRPVARLALGQLLSGWGVTAAMDLSDGLSLDLQRLAEASKAGAELRKVPVCKGASLQQALHGGEDYELLFTAPASRRIPDRATGVRITEIGEITASHRGIVFWQGQPLAAEGYDHFRERTRDIQ